MGTAPDPLVWSAGAHPKRRRLVHAVRDQCLLAWATLYLSTRSGFTVPACCSFALRTLLSGPILLVSWLSGSPFLNVVFTGQWVDLDLGVGECFLCGIAHFV